MNITQLRPSIFLAVFIMLAACSQQPLNEPTAMPTRAPTKTLTPFPTNTSTPTSTLTPTSTPTTIPFTPTPTVDPGVVKGIVRLNNGLTKPFPTSVELRKPQTFVLVKSLETDPLGVFTFIDVMPGEYQVWALLNYQPTPIQDCIDVFPQNETWRMGIKFGEEKAMTMENYSLLQAILLIEELKSSSDLVATGIYVVTDIELVAGLGNYVDATFICE